MNITEIDNTGLKREFLCVIAAQELNKQVDEKIDELMPSVNLKGFRPGKVPRAHIRRLYGQSVFRETVQKTVEESSKKIIETHKLRPAYQPEISFLNAEMRFEQPEDLSFKLSVEVIPDFEIQDLSQLSFVRYEATLDAEETEKALKTFADHYREWEEKPEGAIAEKNDRLTISYVGRVEGQEIKDITEDNIVVELGSAQLPVEFDQGLMGARVGDHITINAVPPHAGWKKQYGDQSAIFEITVAKIMAPKPVILDDAFAKNFGYENWEALKEIVLKALVDETNRYTAMKLKRDVLDILDGAYKIELPKKMVDAEFDNIWKALTDELKQSERSFDDEQTTEEEARQEYMKIAERRVRLGLVLGMIGERQAIKVDADELQDALMKRARQFPGQERMVYNHYRKNPGALVELRGPIFEQKVVDYIISCATIATKTVTVDALRAMAQTGEDDDHHHHDHDDHDHHHDDQ